MACPVQAARCSLQRTAGRQRWALADAVGVRVAFHTQQHPLTPHPRAGLLACASLLRNGYTGTQWKRFTAVEDGDGPGGRNVD
jgi:hypothetical protein